MGHRFVRNKSGFARASWPLEFLAQKNQTHGTWCRVWAWAWAVEGSGTDRNWMSQAKHSPQLAQKAPWMENAQEVRDSLEEVPWSLFSLLPREHLSETKPWVGSCLSHHPITISRAFLFSLMKNKITLSLPADQNYSQKPIFPQFLH